MHRRRVPRYITWSGVLPAPLRQHNRAFFLQSTYKLGKISQFANLQWECRFQASELRRTVILIGWPSINEQQAWEGWFGAEQHHWWLQVGRTCLSGELAFLCHLGPGFLLPYSVYISLPTQSRRRRYCCLKFTESGELISFKPLIKWSLLVIWQSIRKKPKWWMGAATLRTSRLIVSSVLWCAWKYWQTRGSDSIDQEIQFGCASWRWLDWFCKTWRKGYW